MKRTLLLSLSMLLVFLAGCEPLLVLDPKGPQVSTSSK